MILFLYDLQSAINIGMVLRVAEQFRVESAVYDQRGILNDVKNLTTIWDFSCGASDRRPPEIAASFPTYRLTHQARVIATCPDQTGQALPNFTFESSDIILFGNEYDGLPEDVIAKADEKLSIPLPPGFFPKPPSYNKIDPARRAPVSHEGNPALGVASASAIVCYAFRTQIPLKK